MKMGGFGLKLIQNQLNIPPRDSLSSDSFVIGDHSAKLQNGAVSGVNIKDHAPLVFDVSFIKKNDDQKMDSKSENELSELQTQKTTSQVIKA